MKKLLILLTTVILSALIFNCAQEPTKFEDNLNNTAPYFTSIPDTVITVGQNFEYTAQVADDTDPANSLIVTVVKKPAWLNYNSTTKTLSGTTANSNLDGIGNEVELKVTDGLLSKTQSFRIRANSENDTKIEIAPSSLAFGDVTISTTSSTQNFTVRGTNLTNDLIITAPTGYQIANNGGSFGPNITLQQSSGSVPTTTINVRFMPTNEIDYNSSINCESVGTNSQSIAVSGKGVKGIINVSAEIMNFGDVGIGNSSATKHFNISGTCLGSDITITAPLGFVLSTNNGMRYSKNKNTISIQQNNGVVMPTQIDVVFTPILSGSCNSEIICSSLGAEPKSVTLVANGINWAIRNDFGGIARHGAASFAIGENCYIGTGYNSVSLKDFWEYNTATNTWTQISDFGGSARDGATGFSIGIKGYIGLGFNDIGALKDFWEYNPASNIWVKKADFGGNARGLAIGFNIDNKGYIGTGFLLNGSSPTYFKDFWEYDPANNIWVQKTDFGGDARCSSVGFVIGSKGYVGTGVNHTLNTSYLKDFWEYNPLNNSWSQKTDFGGNARSNAIGFAINNRGFIGIGRNSSMYFKDFWEYNNVSNVWIKKSDFVGVGRRDAVGVSIGTHGFIGTGNDGNIYLKDFWQYTPETSTLKK